MIYTLLIENICNDFLYTGLGHNGLILYNSICPINLNSFCRAKLVYYILNTVSSVHEQYRWLKGVGKQNI